MNSTYDRNSVFRNAFAQLPRVARLNEARFHQHIIKCSHKLAPLEERLNCLLK